MLAHTISLFLAAWPTSEPELTGAVLEERLTYPYSLSVGKPKHLWHCRRSPGGCRARCDAFAAAFVRSGRDHGVSPWLLAAMAVRESGLNPAAEGGVHERGILQIHPRNRLAPAFVRDDDYRSACLTTRPGACQAEVVDAAAQELAGNLVKCGGDEGKAVAAYRGEGCNPDSAHARRVEKERLRLLGIERRQRNG